MTAGTFFLWMHLAAIALWVGGQFSAAFVLVPVLRNAGTPDAGRLVALALRRFQRLSREIVLFILLTGLFNLLIAGTARGFHYSPAYLGAFSLKVALFVTMVGIQLWQSIRLAPALACLTEDTPRDDVRRLHRRFLWSTVVNLVLAVTAIFLGLRLRQV